MTPLESALKTYLSRKARLTAPAGRSDNAGRWYPADSERRPCCAHIREPSRAYPWSLWRHCQSLRHVAHLYDVPVSQLRAAVRESR